MKRKIIAGNWKMNTTLTEAIDLLTAINDGASQPERLDRILVFPPMPFIHDLAVRVTHERLFIGSQNVAAESGGAFTGEVAANMLTSVGVSHVLIGHSERRIYQGEDHELLKKKMDISLQFDLKPVFCCGEDLSQRENNRHFEVVELQLVESLFHLNQEAMSKVIVAYEPVWAIGTGKTASVAQAEEMHGFIRQLIANNYTTDLAKAIPILYGGSCNAGNAAALFTTPNIDGGLIGGASLKSAEFLNIIASLND